jgi:mannose-6-phosphate isomerase-like protein (cupin superfamily)
VDVKRAMRADVPSSGGVAIFFHGNTRCVASTTESEETMSAVNLKEKFALFDDHWSPKVVGQLNDTHVKVAKVKGEFVWHHHADTDELFLVHRGRLLLQLRDREDVVLEAGEFFVVPRGVEHRPVAPEEVELVLIEPAGTVNTGNVQNEHTVTEQWL